MHVCVYSHMHVVLKLQHHIEFSHALHMLFLQPTVSLSDEGHQLLQEFDVTLDISEDDGKGSYTPVSMDKDCFKLRQNVHKKVAVALSQPNTDRPLLVER